MADPLTLLRRLEWGAFGHYGWCPACGGRKSEGHTPTCELAALLHPAKEPTVDEMAREMGWRRVHGCATRWVGSDGMTVLEWLQSCDLWARPVADGRLWPTADDAIRTLYAEHKARRAPEESPPSPDTPPTDPASLAAWLYERVVPGQTIAEYLWCGGRHKGVVLDAHEPDGDDLGYLKTHGTAIGFVARPNDDDEDAVLTRLLTPTGAVLWEAKS